LLLAAAILAPACKRHSSSLATTSASLLDWEACARALAAPQASVEIVIAQCPVCGDWKPLLDWATPQTQGGPTKMAIVDAMARCNAWCDGASKTRFLSEIDDARGTEKRTPWRHLGDMCKAAVSAIPDSRFVSAPYFALDRIGRAAAAHGGNAAAALGRLELPLPAASISGSGVKLPQVHAATRDAPRVHVTVLGDQAYVGLLPRAHLGKDGVTVDFGGEPYPGKAVATSELAAAVAGLARGASAPPNPIGAPGAQGGAVTSSVTLLAPLGMAASKLAPLLDALRGKVAVYVAVEDDKLPDWPVPRVLVKPVENVGEASTVQDLAATLTK
jgi:hypothetical protein